MILMKLIPYFLRKYPKVNVTVFLKEMTFMLTDETKDTLISELQKIKDWENEQKDLWFWEKIGRLPFVLLDKLTPKFIQEKVGVAVDELGSYIQTGGQYLISEQVVLKRFTEIDGTIKEITLDEVKSLPIVKMDEVANQIGLSRTKLATVQGATTGIGGIFTLAIDIPLLLGLSLKVLQEVALAYGYDPKEKSERIFIIKCLQFTSSDIVGKKAVIEELAAFSQGKSTQQMISQLEGWREVVFTYRDNFGWKKLFQMIPIAGILFGAYLNRSTVGEVAEAGMMMYRKRRILERLNQLEDKSSF